jgi:two-component system, sensor histidine kinase and response regulator
MQAGGKADRFLILIAEDDPATQLVIRRMMENEGYTVLGANNGEECLRVYHAQQPDLVMLDCLMPVMDGFEVCAKIRQQPKGNELPILMVTTLEDTGSVDLAFEAGADDFITKPIHWAVLRQRVRRMLFSRQAERMRAELSSMIIHDMKTPVAAVNNYAEILLEGFKGELSTEQREILTRIRHNGQTLLDMTRLILDLQRMEEGKLTLNLETAVVDEILRVVADSLTWMAQNYQVKITVTEISDGTATFDWDIITRVITNLLTNAIKHSYKGGVVYLSATCDALGWYVTVRDEGIGIPVEDQNRIFDRFTQAAYRSSSSHFNTGLGLTFCKLAVEAHGGRIELQSAPQRGSTFTVILPKG